jgi:hypothetical protein
MPSSVAANTAGEVTLSLPPLATLLQQPALWPLPGYGTAITLCGLAYGSPASPPVGTHGLFEAWSLAAAGCLGGATMSFLIMRGMLRGPGRHWLWVKGIRDDRRWVAMEAAVRGRGTGMVVLIR